MNFHRVFGSSNLGGNLFIEHASYDPGNNFTLARRQQLEMLPQRRDFSFALAPAPIAIQRDLNRIQKILIAKWFGKKLDGSRLHGSHRHRDVAMRSDKDDRNADVTLGQFLLEIEAADAA